MLEIPEALKNYYWQSFISSNFGDMKSKIAGCSGSSFSTDLDGSFSHDSFISRLDQTRSNRRTRRILASLSAGSQSTLETFLASDRRYSAQWLQAFSELAPLATRTKTANSTPKHPQTFINDLLSRTDPKLRIIRDEAEALLLSALNEFKQASKEEKQQRNQAKRERLQRLGYK